MIPRLEPGASSPKPVLIFTLVLAGAALFFGCDRDPEHSALDHGDPLHEDGITLPPEELGLPPRVPLETSPDFEPVVAEPAFSPGMFPCSRCHEGGDPVVDAAPAMPHGTHLENDLACEDCHFLGDGPEPQIPSVNSCFLCHDLSEEEEEPAWEYFLSIRREGGEYEFPRRWQLQDIIAPHETHAEAGVECAECHGEPSNGPFTKPKSLTLMQTCIDCHEQRGVAAECETCHREIREPTHSNIALQHGPTMTGCYQCHNEEDRDTLRMATGRSLPFEKSYELCGQCHGDKLRDWKQGLHGKRVGSWTGTRRYLLCVHCHQNPHRPSFPPMAPMPPPQRPEDVR